MQNQNQAPVTSDTTTFPDTGNTTAPCRELRANESDMERYKSEYINIIEDHLKTYYSQPVVPVIAPNIFR